MRRVMARDAVPARDISIRRWCAAGGALECVRRPSLQVCVAVGDVVQVSWEEPRPHKVCSLVWGTNKMCKCSESPSQVRVERFRDKMAQSVRDWLIESMAGLIFYVMTKSVQVPRNG